jgi:hypothetical protein
MATQKTLKMPNEAKSAPGVTTVTHSGVVVIVGANGSGKSRLGAWLENPKTVQTNRGGGGGKNAYRIGAQRTLDFPGEAQRLPAERASENLQRGSRGPGGNELSRLQGDPVVGRNEDFGPLIDLLFAQRARLEHEYAEKGRVSGGKQGPPEEDALDRLIPLWSKVFPERQLEVGDHTISAKTAAGAAYATSVMSDGERDGFYLMAQALLAPKVALIVIDEPELHLHQSIQALIWDVIEAERTDCSFVYITHDLEFAASRVSAAKVVLFDYDPPVNDDEPGHWNWDLVPTQQEIPEDVVLRILGSRRPTLFVEGRKGGLDQRVFAAIYSDYFVEPVGGWEQVDRIVRALNAQQHVHHLSAFGLIDRDDRDAIEIAALATHNITALPVGCVEGLLVLPEVLAEIAAAIGLSGESAAKTVADAVSTVTTVLENTKDMAIIERAQYAVRRRIQSVVAAGHGKPALVTAVSTAVAAANPEAAFDAAQAQIESALTEPDSMKRHLSVLAVSRNKALLHDVALVFKLDANTYIQLFVSRASDSKSPLRAALRARVGGIP